MAKGSSGLSSGGVGGSKMTQQADLDHSPELQKALNKEENRTRNLKKEQMTVWDDKDNQVIHRQGKSGSVEYSVREAQQYFYGATMTHNHPHGDERGGISGTFSVADVETFRYGLKEMRASGAEGTYVLRNKNWNNSKADRSMDFWKAYSDFSNKQDFASLENIKASQAKAKKTKIGKQYTAEMDKASSLWKKGDKDNAMKAYNNAVNNLEAGYKKECKRIIYENMNATTSGWLKQNAAKYGFEYVLTK